MIVAPENLGDVETGGGGRGLLRSLGDRGDAGLCWKRIEEIGVPGGVRKTGSYCEDNDEAWLLLTIGLPWRAFGGEGLTLPALLSLRLWLTLEGMAPANPRRSASEKFESCEVLDEPRAAGSAEKVVINGSRIGGWKEDADSVVALLPAPSTPLPPMQGSDGGGEEVADSVFRGDVWT
jgi:hypothetical protein